MYMLLMLLHKLQRSNEFAVTHPAGSNQLYTVGKKDKNCEKRKKLWFCLSVKMMLKFGNKMRNFVHSVSVIPTCRPLFISSKIWYSTCAISLFALYFVILSLLCIRGILFQFVCTKAYEMSQMSCPLTTLTKVQELFQRYPPSLWCRRCGILIVIICNLHTSLCKNHF